jgi:hypothetical protein
MRVMVLVKATADSEAGVMPSTELIDEMGRYNTELVNAGIMLAGEGLTASREGARITFEQKQTTVLDGPFAETKELVSGFWIWQVASMDEAMEWARRAPFVDGELEVRRVVEFADFGENFTEEQQAREDGLRARIAAEQGDE